MKISKLHIEQFRHLENLTFDFTYQNGERKGQPLDKICFIGQSATGKTGLLDLIISQIDIIQDLLINSEKKSYTFLPPEQLKKRNRLNGNISFHIKNKTIYILEKTIKVDNIEYYKDVYATHSQFLNTENKTGALYLKASLLNDKNINSFEINPIELIEKYSNLENNGFYFKKGDIKIFGEEINTESWIVLISEILSYRKKFNQKMSEFIHKGLLGKPEKLKSEFEKWQKENPNELEEFANKFNPILEKLHLEVDLVNTEYVIPIANKRNEEIIPIQSTSTGTKGLLLSFLPLFKLDTKDSIILIDEPERSLYPDMQMDLMDYYQNLAPEAQFIVATHSPFIAASFEPDERFILYFDEQGKVAVRRGNSPIGDDPNDMLYNDFGINYINRYGQEKHNEYKELKQKVFFEKDEKKKKAIIEKLEKLGEEYNF